MRPSLLTPLFAPAQSLAGIGPRLAVLLAKALSIPPNVTEPRIVDLLWHLPTGVIDRRAEPSIAHAAPGSIVTLKVRALKHRPSPKGNKKAPYRVTCEDDTGKLDIVFFHADRRYVEGQLPPGEERFVSGRIELYGDKLQMTHPDYIVPPDQRGDLPLMEPVYGLTAGLSGKVLCKAIRQALDKVPEMTEWQEPRWMAARNWPSFHDAIRHLHRPEDTSDVSTGSAHWQRLAYDELLTSQIALAIVRAKLKGQRGRQIAGDGSIREKIKAALPFSLTGSQTEALKEIAEDMSGPFRMLRLLQGDVGSGKTVVALMAMANAVEIGAQAALMAPTEVLARQHMETIEPLAKAVGLRVALLTGREKGKVRKDILELLSSGYLDILIGTHALFQPDVVFQDLALAVIDEQHRFGVHQRLALQAKGGGGGANMLVMTATPIPRTLLMTHFGDLDVSRLTESRRAASPLSPRCCPSTASNG